MTALDRLQKLPDWPARMTAPVAAAYMGISPGSFVTRFGKLGVKEGANTVWARVQLDRLIAKQFNLAQPSSTNGEGDDSWDDLRCET